MAITLRRPGVRIGAYTHKSIREIAARSGQSMHSVLETAIEQYRRKVFLETANVAFAALLKDRKIWLHEREERAAWDATLTTSAGLQPGIDKGTHVRFRKDQTKKTIKEPVT